MRRFVAPLLMFFIPVYSATAQVFGCTDPLANNFDASATDNDGSCLYPAASASPVTSIPLAGNLSETSGLIHWNGNLWTHNDNSDTNVYSLDTASGAVLQSWPVTGVVNNDWEEISQDSLYVYIGDFGNNGNGNRTDLQILRIEKSSLLAQAPVTDTISFSYSDQIDFTPAGNNNTDFDCEGFMVLADSIYLFTKQWVSLKTKLYSLPKTPGVHVAQMRMELDVQGLITGASLMEDERIVALSGYTSFLQPFVWLLYDFTAADFFGGNKRRIEITLPFHQVEGIATSDGVTWYMSNEYFSITGTQQQLHRFDFTQYLGNYLNSLTAEVPVIKDAESLSLFPNPASDKIFIRNFLSAATYVIKDVSGASIQAGKIDDVHSEVSLSGMAPGTYFLFAGDRVGVILKN